MQNLKKVQNCADQLKNSLPQGFSPKIGIILGTGLDTIARSLSDCVTITHDALPDFPAADSRGGVFSAGLAAGVPVLLQRKRWHLYEGKTPGEICMGVRVMASLGIRTLIATNAAGALNPLFDAGSLMLITDHINKTGQSPLTGPNEESWGPRFPDMSRLYDADCIRSMERAALSLGIRLEKGVYVGVRGPELETRAETRALRILGADAVGMSTIFEVIAARHLGLRILGVSCLSNKNLPDCMEETSIEEITAMAQKAGEQLSALLLAAMPALAD